MNIDYTESTDRTDTGLRLTLNIDNLDDRAILNELISIQRDAAQYLFECASRDLDSEVRQGSHLTQFDYNGDHVDYNPAAAAVLSMLTNEFCGDGHFERDFDREILTQLGVQPSSTGTPEYGPHYHSIRSLLAYILSDAEFVQDLETWSGYSTKMISIDYIDD